MGKKISLTKQELRKLYISEKLNTYQIAEKYGCCQATIWKKLREYGVKARKPQDLRSNIPSKNVLKKLYTDEKLSTWKIEKEYGYSRGTIHRKLKEYGIDVRDRSSSHITKIKKDFSGDLIEKSYLIGFRIGDLGVRKIWPNSKTLVVACSSTHIEQINLLKKLFSKYCVPWIKSGNENRIHFQVHLNESFNFLLSKNIPFWISKNDNYFFSFLAGFIDAEGHIKIYNKMAMFSVGNYNKDILRFIFKNLLKKGIRPKLYTDNRKGKSNNQGYKYNNNYSRLSIYRKEDILKLFIKIKSYIKHGEKIEDLKKAEENIVERKNRLINKMKKETFYITTPIYYTNGDPHIGSAYTTIAADVLARWNKLLGKDVFFLTGTDEHGQKIQETAEQSRKKPKEFVDEIVEKFQSAFKKLNISNDFFIRTTDPKHEKEVQKILQVLYDKGFIYKGDYESYYCVGCEQYLTETDLVDGKCPLHDREPELKKEEAYLFKLSKFQDQLLDLIETGRYSILPKNKRKEIINFIKQGLKDISISRLKEKVSWGVELPFDKKHTCFVWVDAFWNYLTGLKINKKFEKFWPADVQLMARDILRVHATIWPALLLATGNKLPKTLFIHGYFTVNGQKMSKTLGNVIDPIYLTEKYGVDSVRYFLMRNIPFGSDGDVSEDILVERNNSELANKLGNLISRVTSLAEKNGITKTENKLLKKLKLKEIEKKLEDFELDKALSLIFAFIDDCNEYVQHKKPWEIKVQKDSKESSVSPKSEKEKILENKKVLYELTDSIKAISILLWPYIPETCEKIAKNLKFDLKYEEINKPYKVQKVKKSEILFQKVQLSLEKKVLRNKETKFEGIMNMNTIDFSAFAKLELKVGTIKKVEDIEGADKLYKLEVDTGEKRTICAGIKEHYKKDELKGKQIVVITNLEPRKMRGVESNGMLLAAVSDDHKEVVLISPDKKVKSGNKVS